MWTKSKILTRLKKLTESSTFIHGIERHEEHTRYWEGYRAALKDVLETEERFMFPWE